MKSPSGFWNDMKLMHSVWEHPGDPKAPHPRLRDDKCSDGFINLLVYLSSTANLIAASGAMIEKITAKLDGGRLDWVFGSPMAAIPFSTLVGVRMGVPRVGFTEKVDDKNQLCRFDLPENALFLAVEEMTTSGKTPQRLIDAVVKENPGAQSLPFVAAFLMRCEHTPAALRGKEVISVIDLPELGVRYNEWDPEECPLCAAGSRAITNVKKVWPGFLKTMTDRTAYEIPGAIYAELPGYETARRAMVEQGI